MDDLRYLWLRDKVFSGLGIGEHDVFEEFINRNENENEMKIAKFMNQTEEDDDYALIFHKEQREEEIEVQVELCNFMPFKFFFRNYLNHLIIIYENKQPKRSIWPFWAKKL